MEKSRGRKLLKERNKNKCKYVCRDGCGHYCKLIPMDKDKDYPHKFWRVMCFGDQEHLFCEAKKRGLLNKKD